MTNFSYLKLTKTKKIRYLKHNQKNGPYIVFLHGFMSDLEGRKPKTFFNFAKKNKLGFLALEYSGHGKSSGKFINGNISKWTKETNLLIKKIVRKNKIILIGSSMGSWISLNQFKFFKNQINSFLGIGSAPDFLENLMFVLNAYFCRELRFVATLRSKLRFLLRNIGVDSDFTQNF